MRARRLLAPLVALAFGLPPTACLGTNSTEPAQTPTATVETTTFAPSLGIDLSAAGWTRTATGLYYRTLSTPGDGAATVAAGQTLSVRYTGYFADGTSFESSTLSGFPIGRGAVIAGWDQGIVGMRVGERRRLLIPPALGYGARNLNGIPGNSVLVFDVEVLSAA